ncbi:MAG: hypothetical protein ABJQ29_16245 [Luteolibacter sp.]
MKAFLTLIAIGISSAAADVPKKAPLYQYAELWTNSPFTSRPPPVTTGPVNNPLDDFTLTGISPVPGGYRVTIINKKDPNDKQVIPPGGNGTFKIVSVDRNPGETLGTTVVLSNGSMQGTVAFEPDLITLNTAPPAPQQQNPQDQQQNLPPGVNIPNQGDPNSQPTPRPRIVPPAPSSGGNNNSSRGGSSGGSNGSSRGSRDSRR